MRITLTVFIVIFIVCGAGPKAHAEAYEAYEWSELASNFDSPTFIVHADDQRLFVGEQTGGIWIIDNGLVLPEPFLDVSALLPFDVFDGAYSERGLLGMAFHPQYADNRFFFIYYTDFTGHTALARYRVSSDNPNQAEPEGVIILSIERERAGHYGGALAFGVDGYLYVSVGDGGDFPDQYPNAQRLDTLLGKILRLDVDIDPYGIPDSNPFVEVEGARPEIWAYGLRNPWRISFDVETADLLIADVGQWTEEEINYQSADDLGGANYGWEIAEGLHLRHERPLPDNAVNPVVTYGREFGCAVVGGYVYRGQMLDELDGQYFYGDYCSGIVWITEHTSAGLENSTIFMDTDFLISTFGQDAQGELYLADFRGTIYQLMLADG